MRKLILLMAITLDGVVAPANGTEVFDQDSTHPASTPSALHSLPRLAAVGLRPTKMLMEASRVAWTK